MRISIVCFRSQEATNPNILFFTIYFFYSGMPKDRRVRLPLDVYGGAS